MILEHLETMHGCEVKRNVDSWRNNPASVHQGRRSVDSGAAVKMSVFVRVR